MKLSEVYEGWRNHLLPPEDLEEVISTVSKLRLEICSTCEWHSKNHDSKRPDDHCTKCGCTLIAKTKCLSCACPLKKWLHVKMDE